MQITTTAATGSGERAFAHQWYQPSSGRWSSRTVDGAYRVFLGTAYYERLHELLHVVRGEADWLRGVAPADEATAPGVYDDWLSGLKLPASIRRYVGPLHVRHLQGGGKLISRLWAFSSDSGSTTVVHIRSTVSPPMPYSQAVRLGAFQPPTGQLSGRETELRPGEASPLGINAYWFGRSALGNPVHVVYEARETAALQQVLDDWASPARRYDVVYRPASLPAVPGVPRALEAFHAATDSEDLKVETSPVSIRDSGVTEQPKPATATITLVDGETAHVAAWYPYASSRVVVTTRNSRIDILGLPQMRTETPSHAQLCQLVHQLAQLRPVGYHGPLTASTAQSTHCTFRFRIPRSPLDIQRYGHLPIANNPPLGTKEFSLPGARRPQLLSVCTSTSQAKTLANLKKATACTTPLRGLASACYRLGHPRIAEVDGIHAAADIQPRAGCAAPTGELLYALTPRGWQAVFLASHPICGYFATVDVVALQQLFPGYWEGNGPKSNNYLCPG